MKLNVGSGFYPQPGWVNMERWAWSRGHGLAPLPPQRTELAPDLFADITALPFADDCCESVYCGHVLEHLTYDTEAPMALEEIRRVLGPDGKFCAVGPDMDRVMAGPDDAWGWPGGKTNLIVAVEGKGDFAEDGIVHQWIATEANTLALVRTVFPTAEAVPVGTVQGFPINSRDVWQCAVLA
jgi:SAM-dependent methyltransferase